MTTLEIVLWIIISIVGLGGSAIYSGLETGTYSLNRIRLHLLVHQGHPGAKRLAPLIQHPTILLTTLLIGNNVANYMGTAGLTRILQGEVGLGEVQLLVFNVLVTTPLLLVFGETLPKDLFGAFPDRLMYPFARFLTASRWVFTVTGLMPLIRLATSAIMRLMKQKNIAVLHPRRQMQQMMKEGVGEGILSDEQSAMVERVLAVSERRVGDEMAPWREVTTVSDTDSPEKLWELGHRTSISRYPVVAGDGKVVGIVSLYDALMNGQADCPPIRTLMQPAVEIQADMPLREGLRQLQSHHGGIAVVMQHDKPVGIVTIKDLVEPLTGELASW